MKKLLYWIDHYLEEAILVIFLILIACVMMLQIVVRYVFQSPLPWPEEFCRYCFVYSVMIATGYCIRNGSMLRVDVVIMKKKSFGWYQNVIAKNGREL